MPTNLSDNRGLTEIVSAVHHHISQLPHIGTPLPKTWIRVRDALEANNRNYITQNEFLDLCEIHGFKDHEDKLQLSEYLHDLGVCLHFQEDDLLQRYVILKPEWGTTAVYKVLDTPKVLAAFGHFTIEDLKIIWADQQHADMRPELLRLMENFKLCYEIPHRPKTYIAPQLLSPNQPEYQWNDIDNLIVRYQYEFMPKGIITRFIVEMHRLIDHELVWKDGVILTDKDARAEIIEDRYHKEMRIRISGQLKKPLLEKIRGEFDKIHDSYNNTEDPPEKHRLRYQEFIPCNCSACKGSQNPFSYPLNRLQERLKNYRHGIECDISYELVNVRGLIDDAIGPTPDHEDRSPDFGQQRSGILEEELQTRMEKLNRLRQSLAIETDTARKFQLEQQVKAEEEAIAHLESQLSNIAPELTNRTSSSNPSDIGRATNIYHSGDIVYGDKVGQDKVEGDKTEHP